MRAGRAGRAMINHLYYGDNLKVLRDSIADGSVDLIYLDPPFNSNASYNVLFKGPQGNESAAQIEAFDDTWHWNDSAEEAFGEVVQGGNAAAATMLRAMRSFLGDNDMMAYLAMMAVRLLELHRVLRPTGSLYLHCDPTASHYLKRRCCTTSPTEDSHCESMRLDGLHEQAITRPLPHDELVQLHGFSAQARVAADLAGQGDGLARAT